MESSKIKIAVIIGSTRPERFGDKPARWIFEEIKKQTGLDVELLDLRDYPMPFFDEIKPTSSLNGVYASEEGMRWAKKVNEFDGYVIVTPEYNHGYPAVLKNALDYAYTEWNKKPVGFVSYGGVSGARAVEQLRQVVIQLEMVPIQNSIAISEFWTRTDEKCDFKSAGLEDSATRLISQLTWYAKALKVARSSS